MLERMRITDRLYVGAQPTEEQLKQLAGDGFQTVVNLRAEGEDEQPLSPQAKR